ncbi:MAG: nucleotide sugar dehydrogenase [Geminicoccaceae bacterium]
MQIAILGLGYVGTTTAACLAKDGHHVLGVDINAEKVAAIGAGRSPVVEPLVEELLTQGVAEGRVRSAASLDGALDRLDMVIICVGTPSRADGKLDLSHLLESTRQLGQAVRARRAERSLLMVFRSTMPPGTMQRLVLPTLERAAGEGPGPLYEAAFNPEFLRESTAVKDYFNPPKIVIGERAKGVTGRLLGIYDAIDAPLFEVPLMVAEMGKFVDNSWHAVKVAFANEIGRIATARGIDPQAVAEIFLSDTKLNVSPYYLRPGGPYGGSCLPKDLSGMLALARDSGLSVPVLAGARDSNGLHLAWLAQAIRAKLPPPGPILQLGLSFKAGTDDLRNSPLLDLAEILVEGGYDLSVYDPDVDPARLLGVNFAVAAEQAPLMDRMTQDVEAVAARSKLIVLGKPIPGIRERLPAGVPVLDVPRLQDVA